MEEYTYNNGVLRIKSDAPIQQQAYVTITREDTEKITTTEYRIGLKIKAEKSGGYYYAWYSATPQSTVIDNSPALKKMEKKLLETQLAVAELAESVIGGGEDGA